MNAPSARLAQITRWLLWASTLLPLALVAVFIVGRWPEYWKWIAAEDTPMTSLEVTIMYTTALVCWGAAATAALRDHLGDAKRWLYLGSGFLWLCLDDRFALHERIRDRILIPHDVRIPFLPVGPGDFILLIYMAIGLASLRWLLPLWQAHRSARRRFIAGVAVAAFAILLDAYDIHDTSLAFQRFEQTLEECLELIAQVLFLQGVLVAWLETIQPPAVLSELKAVTRE